MNDKNKHNDSLIVTEDAAQYGFSFKSDTERLREDIYRPDIEKLQLFTQMLRRNALLDKAVITHTK